MVGLAISGEALAKRGNFTALTQGHIAHFAHCTDGRPYGGCVVRVKRVHKGGLQDVKAPSTAAPPADVGPSVEIPPLSASDSPGLADIAIELAEELPPEQPSGRGIDLPKPPAEEPPVQEPPAEEPPAGEPPAEEPPAEEPPVEEPPVEEPPVEEPPVEEPPVEEPPVEEPPVEEPPVEEPPAEEPPSEGPLPIFDGAFSSGFPGWHLQALPGRVSLVSSNPFHGQLAARFEVRAGDVEPETGSNRAEVSGRTFHEGEDIYVRDAIRVPSSDTFSGSWQLVNQLHETDWGSSPGIATLLDDERHLSVSAGDGSPAYWRGPQLALERWYELIYRVNLSQSASQGFVEVWLDGVQQTLNNGQTRQYGQTIQTDATYLKVGIYRSSSSAGTSVVEHAGVAVGTSLASVLAG